MIWHIVVQCDYISNSSGALWSCMSNSHAINVYELKVQWIRRAPCKYHVHLNYLYTYIWNMIFTKKHTCVLVFVHVNMDKKIKKRMLNLPICACLIYDYWPSQLYASLVGIQEYWFLWLNMLDLTPINEQEQIGISLYVPWTL